MWIGVGMGLTGRANQGRITLAQVRAVPGLLAIFVPNQRSYSLWGDTAQAPVGSPVALMQSLKSESEYGADFFNPNTFMTGWATRTGWSPINANSFYTNTTNPYKSFASIVVGKWYELNIDFTTSIVTTTSVCNSNSSANPILLNVANGVFRKRFQAITSFITIRANGICDVTVNSMSITEVIGEVASQSTTANCPMLATTPQTGRSWLDAAAMTKSLSVTWTAGAPGACTVYRATAEGITVTAETLLSATTITSSFEFNGTSVYVVGTPSAANDALVKRWLSNYIPGRGPELISNGDFSSGISGWGGYSNTIAWTGSALQVTQGGGYVSGTTMSGLVAGAPYLAKCSCLSADAQAVSGRLYVFGNSGMPGMGAVLVVNGVGVGSRYVVTPAGTTKMIGICSQTMTAGGVTVWDNVSVRAII